METKYNKKQTQEKTTIFLHIPKTGGVTLDAILERQYKLDRFFSLYSPEDVQKFTQNITIMRNPIDRVISN